MNIEAIVISIQDSADFRARIQKAGSKLVIVNFYATWCGSCRAIASHLQQLSADMAAEAVVLKVDVDQNEELPLEYNVNYLPTFVFIKNGQRIDTYVGANFETLKARVQRHI